VIRLSSLRVAYGRTLALDGVDLEIAEGIVGVFGQNGSGKSTLLRVLAGLLVPTSGRAEYNGHAISASNETFRRRVAYAGHEAGLYPRLTIAENLQLFSDLYGAEPERAPEVLRALGLEARTDSPVGELSAGFKRRAAVARALLHDPELLLLDEPYANLDDDAGEIVSSAIRKWHTPERTAIIATHGAKKLKRYAHAGLILQRGRVVTYGRYRRTPTAEPQRKGVRT